MEIKEIGFETICELYPLLSLPLYQGDVQKHEQHDQSTHGSWAEGSLDSGLDAMPYQLNPKTKPPVRPSELSDDEVKTGGNMLKDVAESPIKIRLFGFEMQSILEDGRFRSMQERSGGFQNEYREAREDLENGLWGIPKGQGPIYGYFASGSSVENQTEMYGDVVVTLKESVAGRTTITAGDSANSGLTPVLVTEARSGSLSKGQIDSAFRSRAFQSDATTVYEPVSSIRSKRSIDYFEAQIHGGVSLSDIKSVTIPSTAAINLEIIPQLQAKGIEVIRK